MNRTIDNYEHDLLNPDVESSGIVTRSILNEIPSFHVTENYYADIMHDIFEGVCHYSLCHVIKHYINTQKYFDLIQLNSRMQSFEYGEFEIASMPGKIEHNHLENNKLRMSARQVMTFVKYFPSMIGDLIPTNDSVWMFVLNLVSGIDLVLSFETSDDKIKLLSNFERRLRYPFQRYIGT